MKIGFSSNAFTKKSLTHAIETLSKIGYDGIEIVVDIPHAFLPLNTNKILELKNSLKSNCIKVTNVNSNTVNGFKESNNCFEPSLSSSNEKFRNWRINYTKKSIDFADLINAPSVCITSGLYNKHSEESELIYFKESLVILANYAEQKNINLAIEYEPGLLIKKSEDVWKIICSDFKNIGLNLDTCHATVNNEDIPQIIKKFNDKIFHTHLSDCKNNIHNHLLPGLGDINFLEIKNSLKSINYTGFLTAELYPYDKNPTDAASKAFIYLKNLIN